MCLDSDARFKEEETPVVEMAGDLGLADQNNALKKQLEILVEKDSDQKSEIETLKEELKTIRDTKDQIKEQEGKDEKEKFILMRKEKRKA